MRDVVSSAPLRAADDSDSLPDPFEEVKGG
jgi:hypothetical protein